MFESKTPEALKAGILAEIEQGQGLSSMAGGFADGAAGPICEEMSRVYMALDAVPSMLFVDESSGGYIDLVGEQYFAMARRPGTKAYCSMHFTGQAGLAIPKGTAFLTPGALEFQLLDQVVLDDSGTGTGLLEAAEEGGAYNVGAGTINRMYVNLPGLASYSNDEAQGGTDQESDAALLARIRERVRRPPTSGNGYHYRQWAMSVAGVGNAKVVELRDGPGTVGVVLVDSNYEPPAPAIVEEVQACVAAERPVGASVTVEAATGLPVTVSASVMLTQGTALSSVQSAFELALTEYLHTLIDAKFTPVYYEPEEDASYSVLYNRILALLLTVPGVENFSVLTVNGGTSDVSVGANQIPTLDDLEVGEA